MRNTLTPQRGMREKYDPGYHFSILKIWPKARQGGSARDLQHHALPAFGHRPRAPANFELARCFFNISMRGG